MSPFPCTKYRETVLGQIYGEMFYIETNDQIMHRGKLGRVKLGFLSLILTLVIDIFEKLTPQIGD